MSLLPSVDFTPEAPLLSREKRGFHASNREDSDGNALLFVECDVVDTDHLTTH